MSVKRVSVYVSTYKKYSEGNLDGAWLYPADYDSLEDFYDACRELNYDEDSPEFMYQDVEYLPRSLYDESVFTEEAFNFAKDVDGGNCDIDAATVYADLFGNWDIDDFEDSYMGHYDSVEDYCWEYIDGCGGISEAVKNLENYFDYEQFGRELKFDLDEDEDAYYYDMDDEELGKNWIEDNYGDIKRFAEENPEKLEDYFDIKSYALDVSHDISEQDGYIFLNN